MIAVIRILGALLVIGALLWALWTLFRPYVQSPEQRMLRQYHEMRELVLEAVDEAERDRVERLLDDCGDHLRALIRAQQRLDVLDEMADTAEELTGAEADIEPERLRERVHENMTDLLAVMGRVSSEVDYDWRQSVEQLESFTDELEERRTVFAELEQIET